MYYTSTCSDVSVNVDSVVAPSPGPTVKPLPPEIKFVRIDG